MEFIGSYLEGTEMTTALAQLLTSEVTISVIASFRWRRKVEGEGLEKLPWKLHQHGLGHRAIKP